jgi:hypothetical protein
MTTSEERMRILQMIQEGKITAEEGAKLLEALGKSKKPPVPPLPPRPPHAPGRDARLLRVRITDLKTGKTKVNVNIPMGLVNVGIRLGARFMPTSADVDFDEIMAAIDAGTTGKVVDVEEVEEGERVEVWIE